MPTPTSASAASAVAASGTVAIDALARGVKWGGALGTGVTVSFSFPWSTGTPVFAGLNGVGDYSSDNEPPTSFGFNPAQQQAARAALQTWADVANIRFVEVADTASSVGDIRFAWTAFVNGDATAWARQPSVALRPSGGDVWFSAPKTSADATSWPVGSSNFTRLIHEIGHTLGFKHPGNYDNGGDLPPPPFLPAELDNRTYTVMSYNDPPNDLFRTLVRNADGTITRVFTDVRPDGPMVLDIAAIQYLYGANTGHRTGNDVYTFDPRQAFLHTIWDAGGVDTISAANFVEPCRIDLRAGSYSTLRIVSEPLPPGSSPAVTIPTYDGTNNLGIAFGAVIENAIGGVGNDTLIGNEARNTLTGGAGNDTLDGGAGLDLAVFDGQRSAYRLTRAVTGEVAVADTRTSGGTGVDSLTRVERLQFADRKIAFDLDGAAGLAARLLGAGLGTAALADARVVGIALSVFDASWTLRQAADALVALPLFQQLASGSDPQALASFIGRNVLGAAPSGAQLNAMVGALAAGISRGELLALVAELDLNAQHIGLTGLASSGIEFV